MAEGAGGKGSLAGPAFGDGTQVLGEQVPECPYSLLGGIGGCPPLGESIRTTQVMIWTPERPLKACACLFLEMLINIISNMLRSSCVP